MTEQELTGHRSIESYHQDTLAERLAEEEPDTSGRSEPGHETAALATGEVGSRTTDWSDDDVQATGDMEQLAVEDVAMHIGRR